MTWSRFALLGAVLLLSGCAGPALPPPSPDASGPSDAPHPAAPTPTASSPTSTQPEPADAEATLWIRGTVLSPALVPLANATVSLVALPMQEATGPDGAFDFGRLPRRIYTLKASAAGFLDETATVLPESAQAPLKVVLQAGYPAKPYNVTVEYHGFIECALEVLIISPSCDSALTLAPGSPRLFQQNATFLFGADPGWTTLVADVVFDAGNSPGLDGLRTVLRGTFDPASNGTYEQYGRWHGSTTYTIRVEPGGTYTDGVKPVPGNTTGFQLDVYPQGMLYHQACVETTCFLGAGAGSNVRFDVFATLFYVDPAPPGYSFPGARP